MDAAAAEIARLLRCPLCGADLTGTDRALRCRRGHSFDLARQGYVNPRVGARTASGDSAAMVTAREGFLAAGHFDPLTRALIRSATSVAGPDGCVVDVGAGTGHHLARVMDRLPDRVGLAVDASAYALRRAARAHPRVAAIGADTWRGLPVRTSVAALVLCVFAPRDGAELARIARPDGALLVVTPTDRHLTELVGPLGLVSVDPAKDRRTADRLDPYFDRRGVSPLEFTLTLTRADAVAAAVMGPTGWHAGARELAERAAGLPEPIPVTGSVTVSTYRPR